MVININYTQCYVAQLKTCNLYLSLFYMQDSPKWGYRKDATFLKMSLMWLKNLKNLCCWCQRIIFITVFINSGKNPDMVCSTTLTQYSKKIISNNLLCPWFFKSFHCRMELEKEVFKNLSILCLHFPMNDTWIML